MQEPCMSHPTLLFWEFLNLVVSNLLVCNLYTEALFCAFALFGALWSFQTFLFAIFTLRRSFALFCTLALFALFWTAMIALSAHDQVSLVELPVPFSDALCKDKVRETWSTEDLIDTADSMRLSILRLSVLHPSSCHSCVTYHSLSSTACTPSIQEIYVFIAAHLLWSVLICPANFLQLQPLLHHIFSSSSSSSSSSWPSSWPSWPSTMIFLFFVFFFVFIFLIYLCLIIFVFI